MKTVGRIIYLSIIILAVYSQIAFANEPADTAGSTVSFVKIQNIVQGYDVTFAHTNDYNIFSSPVSYDNFQKTDRLCPYCSFFAKLFAIFLVIYAFYLNIKAKSTKLSKHWFAPVIFVAILVYTVHGVVHSYFADTIFLDYYWMILFDELLVAFLVYWIIVSKHFTQGKTYTFLGKGV